MSAILNTKRLTWAQYRGHLLGDISAAALKGGLGLWWRHIFVTLKREKQYG